MVAPRCCLISITLLCFILFWYTKWYSAFCTLLSLHLALGFTLAYPVNLALALHVFSTQLTSHFHNFKFWGSDIWIGPVKSSGQLVQLGSTVQGWKCVFGATVWFDYLEVDDPSAFSLVPLFTVLLNAQFHLIFTQRVQGIQTLGITSHFILRNSPNFRVVFPLTVSCQVRRASSLFFTRHALTGIIIKSFLLLLVGSGDLTLCLFGKKKLE